MVGTRRRDSELIQRLEGIPLFSSCSKKELRAIAGAMKEVAFDEGQTICEQGAAGAGLHFVLEGDVKVQIDGRTRRRMGTGAFFGEIALLDGGPRSATVTAETPVHTLALSSWAFRSVLRAHPSLSLKILEEVAGRLRTSDRSPTN